MKRDHLRAKALLTAGSGLLALSGVAAAQTVYQPAPVYAPAPPPPPVYSPAPAPPVTAVTPLWGPQQLDTMTGAIALYPDPLLAEVLTGATYPVEIAAASQWSRYNPNPPEDVIQAQPWDPSVQALVHYPTVLQMMGDNMQWTQALGAAFINQPADVTASLQRLRQQALAVGTLYSTPQQQVVVQPGMIQILPAQPQVIYVPVYDPGVVYVRHEYPMRDAISFRIGPAGIWLDRGVDWDRHDVVVGHWEPERHNVVMEHPWERDEHRPVLIEPRRPDADDARGWRQPVGDHDEHAAPRGFGEYENRGQAEHEEQRGRESMHVSERGPSHAPVATPPARDVGRNGGHVTAGRDAGPVSGRETYGHDVGARNTGGHDTGPRDSGGRNTGDHDGGDRDAGGHDGGRH